MPVAINDAGIVAGSVRDSRLRYEHSFVREADGTITTFDAAANKTCTVPHAMNAKGVITGATLDANHYRGFVRSRPTPGRPLFLPSERAKSLAFRDPMLVA